MSSIGVVHLDFLSVWGIVAKLVFVDVRCVVCAIVGDVFTSASGATASASFIVQGGFFFVVVIPIAWEATNTLYEFFVGGLDLRGLVLVLAGRRVAATIFVFCSS